MKVYFRIFQNLPCLASRIFIVFSTMSFLVSFMQIDQAVSKEVRNTSGFKADRLPKLPEAYGIRQPLGGRLCKGKISTNENLTGIFNAKKKLKNGIACISADFDGNGYLDFALLDKGWHEDQNGGTETLVSTLFFNAQGWMHTTVLPEKVNIFSFELYPPRKNRGKFGEPAGRLAGLVNWGEGGTTKVFLFDPNTKKFNTTVHASENN